MGYELGEKSSKKVHEVLKNSDSTEISESQSVNTSVPQRQHDYGLIALGRKNSNGTASTSTDNIASEYKDADSELEKVAEFLGNATTTGKRKHDKRPVHERKKILYVNASTLHSKLHAGSLNSPVTSASGNTTMEKAEKLKSQKEAILPISSDDIVNQQAIERVKSSTSHTHHYKNNDMHEQQYQGIENGYLMPNSLGGMQAIDLSGTMVSNKHQGTGLWSRWMITMNNGLVTAVWHFLEAKTTRREEKSGWMKKFQIFWCHKKPKIIAFSLPCSSLFG